MRSLTSGSLPPMGIRNFDVAGDDGVAVATHYPPWGSGTLPPCEHGAGRVRLITPHGDQEQVDAGDDDSCDVGSLPPMGIRNAAGAFTAYPVGVRGSLPPMGIRNSRGSGGVVDITVT